MATHRPAALAFSLALVLGTGAWASGDDSAPQAPDLVPSLRQDDETADRLAQRRRRRRGGEEAEAPDNPYGDQEAGSDRSEGSRRSERAEGGEAEEPPTSRLRSDDPRTNGESGEDSGGPARAPADAGAEGSMQRSDRLDFDERLIQGQTARSGAVYLFSRPPRDLPELVKLRRSFRPEISRTVVGREPIAQAEAAAAAPAPAPRATPAEHPPTPAPTPASTSSRGQGRQR